MMSAWVDVVLLLQSHLLLEYREQTLAVISVSGQVCQGQVYAASVGIR